MITQRRNDRCCSFVASRFRKHQRAIPYSTSHNERVFRYSAKLEQLEPRQLLAADPVISKSMTPEGLKLYQPIEWVGQFDIQHLGDDKELYRWPHLITGNRARDDYAGLIAMTKTIGAPAEKLEQAVAEMLDVDS